MVRRRGRPARHDSGWPAVVTPPTPTTNPPLSACPSTTSTAARSPQVTGASSSTTGNAMRLESRLKCAYQLSRRGKEPRAGSRPRSLVLALTGTLATLPSTRATARLLDLEETGEVGDEERGQYQLQQQQQQQQQQIQSCVSHASGRADGFRQPALTDVFRSRPSPGRYRPMSLTSRRLRSTSARPRSGRSRAASTS
jgi:hypothetical protein